MARCERCYGCRFMFDMNPCEYCNYPCEDIRSLEQKERDDAIIKKVYGEENEI